MAANLSSIFSAITGASWNSTLGQYLVSLSNASWVRKIPQKCAGCDRLATHTAARDGIVLSFTDRKAAMNELFAKKNAIKSRCRAYQGYLMRMDRQGNGILYRTTGTIIDGLNNPSKDFGSWRVSSISGNTVTCYYDGPESASYDETDDPRALQFTTVAYNPDYGIDPEAEEYLNTTTTFAAPSGGILTFTAPSVHQWHNGFVVRKWVVPDDLGDGDTFQIIIDRDGSDLSASDVWPSTETDPVRVSYRCYTEAAEPWPEIRMDTVFWGTKQTFSQASPTQTTYTLEAAAKVYPSEDFFTLEKKVSGAWSDVASPLSYLKVANTPSATLDITSLDLTGVTDIRCTYWKQDNSDTDAIPLGQDRCIHSICDPTGSWGETKAGEDGKHYCELKASASGAANFDPDCLLCGNCDGFELDTVGAAIPHGVMDMITHGIPWLEWETGAGLGTYVLYRKGCPSLLSLAGDALTLPSGNYREKNYSLDTGKWPQYVRTGTYNVMYPVSGLELENLTGSSAPDFSDSGTWPDYGPGGNTWTRLKRYGTGNMGDTEDPNKLLRSMVTDSSPTISPYLMETLVGEHGWGQRCGTNTETIWFPVIANTFDEQTYAFGTVQRGYWKADLTEQESEDEDTVYYTKVTVTNDRISTSGTKHTATIKRAQLSGSYLELSLENQIFTAKHPTTDADVEYRQCGGNAPLPYHAATRNYGIGFGLGANRQLPIHGDVVQFNSGGLNGIRHWLISTEAGGSDQTNSWKPLGSEGGTESDFYDSTAGVLGVGSQPTNHKNWANYRDLYLVERNAYLQAFITANGYSWFEDKTVTVLDDGKFSQTIAAKTNSYDSGASDSSLVEGTHYLWLGANGEFYSKSDLAGKCLRLDVARALCHRDVRANALNSITKTLEAMS